MAVPTMRRVRDMGRCSLVAVVVCWSSTLHIASLLSELRQTPPGSTSPKVRYRASHCGTISFDLPHQSVASAIFHGRLVSRIKNGPPAPAPREKSPKRLLGKENRKRF